MVLRWDRCWFPSAEARFYQGDAKQSLSHLKLWGLEWKPSKSDQIRSLSCWSEVWATNPSHNLRLGLPAFSHVSIIKGTTAKRLAPRVHRWPPGLLAPEPLNLRSSRTIFSFTTLAETSFTTMTSKHKLIAVATEADDIKAEFMYRVHGGGGGIYT